MATRLAQSAQAMTPMACLFTRGRIRLLEARRVVPPMTQINYLIKLLRSS